MTIIMLRQKDGDIREIRHAWKRLIRIAQLYLDGWRIHEIRA